MSHVISFCRKAAGSQASVFADSSDLRVQEDLPRTTDLYNRNSQGPQCMYEVAKQLDILRQKLARTDMRRKNCYVRM